MTDTLYLRLGNDLEQSVEWWRTDQGGRSPLAEVVAQPPAARLVVLAPAARMLCVSAQMPPLKGARLQQALPYAVEDQLAEEVEALHFTPGPRLDDGRQTAVAVARADMQAWLALLQRYELRPHAMYHEVLALPLADNAWSLLLQDDEALLRTGAYQGVAMPLEELYDWLNLAWGGRAEGIEALQVFDARSQPRALLEEQLPEDMAVSSRQELSAPLMLMAAELSRGGGINLLSGDFSMGDRLGKLMRPWRPALILLGVWLLLQGGLAFSHYQQLKRQDAALHQAIIETYREAFPEAVNIVNPRVQMERELAGLRGHTGGNPFINLLNEAAPLLAAAEAVTLRNMRYRQDELELELELASLAQLETLKDAFERQGLRVEIRGATTRDDKVEARLALREGSV